VAGDRSHHGLPTAPTRSENIGPIGGPDSCLRAWELELLVDDVNLYRDLARADTPARGLRQVTHDQPAHSPRYRELLRPNGFDDEMRAVARVDGISWASVSLFRRRGRPAFDLRETELVAGTARPLAEAVRHHVRSEPSRAAAEGHGPGLMLFAPGGELISANDEALAWLERTTAA
jgi:hypothetical protein